MRLKKIISLSLALLTGISVLPMQPFAASSGGWEKTEWPGDPGTSSVISQGDIYYLEKKGSSVYPEKYKFKADGSDGDGIPTNSQKVMQDGHEGPIVKPWEQFYDGLSEKEKKEYILVRDKITITKKDKKGNPLSGIQFKLAYKEIENKNDGSKKYEFYKDSTNSKVVYTTDEHGKCTITFSDNKWGPMYLVETVPHISGKPKYKSKTIKLYRDPGTRFLGEVSGNELGITFNDLRYEVRKQTPEVIDPKIEDKYSKNTDEIIKQDKNEEKNGGTWLKFIDRDQFGKIHVFYVAKRPILKSISWNDIHSAGMVYGWDVINPNTGLPRSNPLKYTNSGKPYEAYMKKVNGNKYIVRLLQGKTNYGGDVTSQKIYRSDNDNNNSEWNRVMLPLVQGYRFGSDTDNSNYAEDLLRQSDRNSNYSLRKYTTKTAQYNWFGDLMLGSYHRFTYNGKLIDNNDDGIGPNGQWNWTQEYVYSADYRSCRGCGLPSYGAAFSGGNGPGDAYGSLGFRPVLEVAPKEYDGVVFEGEVTGKELGITYDELRKKVKKKSSNATVPEVYFTTNADEIIKQNKYEEANGGMWLKFTDYKHKRKNTETGVEEPRTFYVAKKPILKNISWNDIHSAGMVYGWDVINPNTGLPRSNPEKYKNGSKDYQATILKNQKDNNKEYIVRLLQGKTNYNGDVTNQKIYRYNNDNNNSEWNRVILPLVQGYRFGSNTDNNNYAEDLLRRSDGNSDYFARKYTNNTAQYNWFGDLTLGAYYKFVYNGKEIDNGDNGTGSNGQWNWTQEYAYSADNRSCRGNISPGSGAAVSNYYSAGGAYGYVGFRPVLEPLNN